jgi:cell division protein FtsL
MRKKKRRKYVTYHAKARKTPRLNMESVVKWSVVAVIVIATAVVYVWQRNTIITLGYEISNLKKEIREAGTEELKLQAKLAPLYTTQHILKQVREKGLDLAEVPPGQRMTLVMPRPIEVSPTRRKLTQIPPAASGSLANVSAAAPHRDYTVLRQKR